MDKDEALAILAAHQAELQELGVIELYLFGSVARNEAGPDSDVDILVEIRRPMGLFIQQYLEGVLGRSVDLVTRNGLRPAFRDQVLEEAVRAA